jgi:hypothetical protein
LPCLERIGRRGNDTENVKPCGIGGDLEIEIDETMHQDAGAAEQAGQGCYDPPANFFLATGRANAFVGPCPLFAITLP